MSYAEKKIRDRDRQRRLRGDPEFRREENAKAQEYRDANREQVRATDRRSAAKRRRLLNLLKMERPCYDCGNDFPPVVTDWDHLPGKEKLFSVGAQQKSFSLDACIDEINKCQLVCSNCHRLRTEVRKEQKGMGN